MDRWARQLDRTLKTRGMSRNVFAALSGVSPSILSRWMRDQRGIQSDTLERVEVMRARVEQASSDDIQAMTRRAIKASKKAQGPKTNTTRAGTKSASSRASSRKKTESGEKSSQSTKRTPSPKRK